jgi:hypothetical protein
VKPNGKGSETWPGSVRAMPGNWQAARSAVVEGCCKPIE